MKLLIIGDTHDNVANIKHVMGFAKKINASYVIHTGDWHNIDNIDLVKSYNIPLITVLGNADINPDFENELKEIEFLEIDNLKIAVIHNIKNLKEDKDKYDFIFAGHLHKQQKIKNVYYPGSLENDINFAVFDTITKEVEFINEQI